MSLLGHEMPSHGHGEAPRRPHAVEARRYLAVLRLCDVAFYGCAGLLTVSGLPFSGLLSLAAALLGSLLLQQDPFLECVGRPMAKALEQSLDWAKWAWSDGWTYLLPLLGTSCLASLLGFFDLVVSMPSHSTGLTGSLRPLAVIISSSIHVFTAACCWHLRGLVFRPHGGVSYAELFPSHREDGPQFELTPVPQAEEPMPRRPPPRVETVPLQSQIARPVHSDVELANALVPNEPVREAVPAADQSRTASPTTRGEDPEVCTAETPIYRAADHSTEAGEAGEAGEACGAAESDCEACSIDVLIRLPTGRRLRSTFLSTDPVSKIYDVVEAESSREPEIRAGYQYWLIQAHPREVYSDKAMTIARAGLQNLTVLNVELQR